MSESENIKNPDIDAEATAAEETKEYTGPSESYKAALEDQRLKTEYLRIKKEIPRRPNFENIDDYRTAMREWLDRRTAAKAKLAERGIRWS